jgi:hypothetical protein
MAPSRQCSPAGITAIRRPRPDAPVLAPSTRQKRSFCLGKLSRRIVVPAAWINDGAARHGDVEAVNESGTAGETACATTSSAVFPKVGQAVSPADFLSRRFLYSFVHGSRERQDVDNHDCVD